jgi:N-acetylglutamate synthase-like GNAT family acetyltransferase
METIIYKKIEENEIIETKKLIMEYIKWLNMDLSFQNIDDELNNFPEKYKEPGGAFYIAKYGNNIIGCVGLKKLDTEICEMKRLFVNDNYKGKGIGKKLVEIIINEGKIKDYKKIRLDTINTMETALKIYYKYGFYKIEPYVYNPNEGTVYLEKIL